MTSSSLDLTALSSLVGVIHLDRGQGSRHLAPCLLVSDVAQHDKAKGKGKDKGTHKLILGLLTVIQSEEGVLEEVWYQESLPPAKIYEILEDIDTPPLDKDLDVQGRSSSPEIQWVRKLWQEGEMTIEGLRTATEESITLVIGPEEATPLNIKLTRISSQDCHFQSFYSTLDAFSKATSLQKERDSIRKSYETQKQELNSLKQELDQSRKTIALLSSAAVQSPSESLSKKGRVLDRLSPSNLDISGDLEKLRNSGKDRKMDHESQRESDKKSLQKDKQTATSEEDDDKKRRRSEEEDSKSRKKRSESSQAGTRFHKANPAKVGATRGRTTRTMAGRPKFEEMSDSD